MRHPLSDALERQNAEHGMDVKDYVYHRLHSEAVRLIKTAIEDGSVSEADFLAAVEAKHLDVYLMMLHEGRQPAVHALTALAALQGKRVVIGFEDLPPFD